MFEIYTIMLIHIYIKIIPYKDRYVNIFTIDINHSDSRC